ncbi:MAG: hypothetical protein K8963_07925, partial [Proteobacteria bacterium]|nr:hypothetical protein [Pseudomonadota bacterium]
MSARRRAGAVVLMQCASPDRTPMLLAGLDGFRFWLSFVRLALWCRREAFPLTEPLCCWRSWL